MRNAQRDNVQSKIVAGANYEEPCTREIVETAKDNLRNHFSIVGLSARLEESLALMKLRFGWKLSSYSSFNITRSRPKMRDLPPGTLDLIHQRNAFDIELYACGQEIFERAVQANADEVRRIAGELVAARVAFARFAGRNALQCALDGAQSGEPRLLGRLRSSGHRAPWLGSLNQEHFRPVAFKFCPGVLMDVVQHGGAVELIKRRVGSKNHPGTARAIYGFF